MHFADTEMKENEDFWVHGRDQSRKDRGTKFVFSPTTAFNVQ